jgi:hypothetical protein
MKAGLTVKRAARSRPWSPPQSAFAGFRFPADVIVLAVRWYLRYGLSYRDVEELLAERGSRSTTSRSTGGCSASPRCWPTRPDSPGTHLVIDGSSTRRSAPRGALPYPQFSWEGLGGRFLGLMAYLRSKG